MRRHDHGRREIGVRRWPPLRMYAGGPSSCLRPLRRHRRRQSLFLASVFLKFYFILWLIRLDDG